MVKQEEDADGAGVVPHGRLFYRSRPSAATAAAAAACGGGGGGNGSAGSASDLSPPLLSRGAGGEGARGGRSASLRESAGAVVGGEVRRELLAFIEAAVKASGNLVAGAPPKLHGVEVDPCVKINRTKAGEAVDEEKPVGLVMEVRACMHAWSWGMCGMWAYRRRPPDRTPLSTCTPYTHTQPQLIVLLASLTGRRVCPPAGRSSSGSQATGRLRPRAALFQTVNPVLACSCISTCVSPPRWPRFGAFPPLPSPTHTNTQTHTQNQQLLAFLAESGAARRMDMAERELNAFYRGTQAGSLARCVPSSGCIARTTPSRGTE